MGSRKGALSTATTLCPRTNPISRIRRRKPPCPDTFITTADWPVCNSDNSILVNNFSSTLFLRCKNIYFSRHYQSPFLVTCPLIIIILCDCTKTTNPIPLQKEKQECYRLDYTKFLPRVYFVCFMNSFRYPSVAHLCRIYHSQRLPEKELKP